MIRLITFDLDNTLWDVTPVLLRAEKTLYQWILEQVPEASPYYQKDQLLSYRQTLLQERPELAKLPTTLRKAMLTHCFSQAGLAGNALQEAVDTAFTVFHNARNQIEFFPETIPLLETLAKEFELIALSNGNADINMVGLGNYFSQHYSAESTGKPKPDPTMFQAALQHANVRPEQAIHIGDHQDEDILAAKALGFRTIWFNNANSQDKKYCSPDREVHHLNQLVSTIKDLSD